MKKRQKQVAGKEIPDDLITDILSRLPAKSIARFRCVSKQWVSLLHRPHFPELFLTFSPARPRLLFASQLNGKWFFSSAPQRLNPDQNSSSLVVDHHKPFPSFFSFDMCAPVHGLICTNSTKPMICNTSTGKYIALPKVTSKGHEVTTYFGYDPVNKTFKVLSLLKQGYRVLTLGSRWRTIECSTPHSPVRCGFMCKVDGRTCNHSNGICINGVVYYIAYKNGTNHAIVVCFDVRSETFKCLDIGYQTSRSTLINYKGRLAAVRYRHHTRLELLVLVDVDRNEWSNHVYVFPYPLRRTDSAEMLLHVVGMTSTGDFVLSPKYTRSGPFNIFYYNVERNTLVSAEVELGIIAWTLQYVYIFVDHIENVKLMQKHITA